MAGRWQRLNSEFGQFCDMSLNLFSPFHMQEMEEQRRTILIDFDHCGPRGQGDGACQQKHVICRLGRDLYGDDSFVGVVGWSEHLSGHLHRGGCEVDQNQTAQSQQWNHFYPGPWSGRAKENSERSDRKAGGDIGYRNRPPQATPSCCKEKYCEYAGWRWCPCHWITSAM